MGGEHFLYKVTCHIRVTLWNVQGGSNTRWFKYDRDYLCVNKSQFVPVIFEPPCIRINLR